MLSETVIFREGIPCDQDVEIKLSYGKKLYADIYRPDSDEKVPAILCRIRTARPLLRPGARDAGLLADAGGSMAG